MEMEHQDFDLIETEALKLMLKYCNMLHKIEQVNILKKSLKETIEEASFSRALKLIDQAQQECKVLKKLIAEDDKKQVSVKTIEGTELAHYKNKIYVPCILREAIVEWYHKMLVHPGTSRLEETPRQAYWSEQRCWVLLQKQTKKQKKKYGKLPAKKVEEIIWSRVNVDLRGPATVSNKKDGKMKMHIMKMMDPVSCWFEVVPIHRDPSR